MTRLRLPQRAHRGGAVSVLLVLGAACSTPETSTVTPADVASQDAKGDAGSVADGARAVGPDSTAADGATAEIAVPADAATPSDAVGTDTTQAADSASDAAAADAVADVAADIAVSDAGLADAASSDTAGLDVGAADAASDATASGDCPDRAKIVYVVTQEDKLFSFAPDTLKTTLIGKLACPGAVGSPFSMSVDRTATAWVLYTDGALYEVSTLDAACKKTAFVPGQQKFDSFGMGFSADAPGAVSEQLYVAGGGKNGFSAGPNKLATIDIKTFQLSVVGLLNPVGSGPDLSGNGNGELWGFFASTQPPSVRQIDKTTAVTGKAFLLPGAEFSGIGSWAFASWGGDFYLFSRNSKQTSTAVYKLDGVTGAATKVIDALGSTVTGAGVSSCAPSLKAP